jgi:hypothetical protein
MKHRGPQLVELRLGLLCPGPTGSGRPQAGSQGCTEAPTILGVLLGHRLHSRGSAPRSLPARLGCHQLLDAACPGADPKHPICFSVSRGGIGRCGVAAPSPASPRRSQSPFTPPRRGCILPSFPLPPEMPTQLHARRPRVGAGDPNVGDRPEVSREFWGPSGGQRAEEGRSGQGPGALGGCGRRARVPGTLAVTPAPGDHSPGQLRRYGAGCGAGTARSPHEQPPLPPPGSAVRAPAARCRRRPPHVNGGGARAAQGKRGAAGARGHVGAGGGSEGGAADTPGHPAG